MMMNLAVKLDDVDIRNPFRTSFAENIFRGKYAQGPADTWLELCRRLIEDVCGTGFGERPFKMFGREEAERLLYYMASMKFIPGGRYLYYAGRPLHFWNNCGRGSHCILTRNGMERMDSFFNGQQIEVYSPVAGKFLPATMHCHGEQNINEITLTSVNGGGRSKKEWKVYFTENHHWPLLNSDSSDTYKLKVGDIIPAAKVELPSNELAFLHGMIFADGHIQHLLKTTGEVAHGLRLCGDKAKYLHAIESLSVVHSVSYPSSSNGDPILYIKSMTNMKELPREKDPSYIASFIEGWLALDGSFSDVRKIIHSINEDAIDWFIENAHLAGYIITGEKLKSKNERGFSTGTPIYHVNFQSAIAFKGFKVKNIKPLGKENVYCPFEPIHNRIVIDYGIDTYQCFIMKAEVDTREEWARLVNNATSALMAGGGIGVDYSVLREAGRVLKRTGGVASGPLSLMKMINEVGRYVMQGGSRRSAIYASLNWQHGDILDFIMAKNWSDKLVSLKADDFNFPAPLDMTNLSVNWDTEFIESATEGDIDELWRITVRQMMETGEPGHSYNFYDNEKETGRNAPVAGGTHIMTDSGYRKIIDVVDSEINVWTGTQYAKTIFRKTASNANIVKVNMTGGRHILAEPSHPFMVERWVGAGKNRKMTMIERIPAGELQAGDILNVSMPSNVIATPFDKCSYTMGFAYGDGNFSKCKGEIPLCSDEKKELLQYFDTTMFTSISENMGEKNITRCYFKAGIGKGRSKNAFPTLELSERQSFIAGLFDADGNWTPDRKCIRLASIHREFLADTMRTLEELGILSCICKGSPGQYIGTETFTLSIMSEYVSEFKRQIPTKRLKVEDHVSYRASKIKVISLEQASPEDVYCCNVGVQEHSFMADGVIISNCGEVSSEDDSDVCNLGSVNMGRIDDISEFCDVVELASKFLVCGSVHGTLPYEKVYKVREKNRRIGLGIMGAHEWLLKRGLDYRVNQELSRWLMEYRHYSEKGANEICDRFYLGRPVKYRAVAPTGCQRPDTMVVTNDGILELDELGDRDGQQWQNIPFGLSVAQEDMSYRPISKFFVNGIARTKKIIFTSANELECTPNHKYRAKRGSNYAWVEAGDIAVGDKLVVALNTYHKIDEPDLLPVRKWYRTERIIEYPSKMTPYLAWFIGVFHGDGSMHEKGIRIACNVHQDKYKKVVNAGKTIFGIDASLMDNGRGCLSVGFESKQLLRWLHLNGLDKKHSVECEVPVIMRCASRKSLKAFINGYFFADGSYRNKNKQYKYIDTASLKLKNQLIVILRALGTDVNVRIGTSGRGSTMYRINFIKTKRKCESNGDSKWLESVGLSNCTLDEVESIEDGEAMTLDIEVPITRTYVANGIVSHNTIGILASTTTGIEPMFAVAYKRRYLTSGTQWKYEYVIDATAQALIDKYGLSPDKIETAYGLAQTPRRRVAFQHDVQKYVDHCISSTINLPAWGTEFNNEDKVDEMADMLLEYCMGLRGITMYPDGARGGQPLEEVSYDVAAKHRGVVWDENEEKCKGGVCGL